MFDNLEFYDKNGYNLNLTLNSDGIYEANIFIPNVSTGLYEISNIFIYERFDINGANTIGKIQNLSGNIPYKIRYYWENIGDANDNIFLYNVDINQQLVKNNVIEQDTDNNNFYTSVNTDTNRKITNEVDIHCNKIQVGLNSTIADEYEKTLIIDIYDFDLNTNIIIGKFNFYGEVIGEDVRLYDLLTNIGENFPNSDHNIFATTDPEEYNPDWIILNKKKKELMLENGSIKNYEMSYFGLVNAINFYGYNLGIKEWWQNIDTKSTDYQRYKLITVIDSLTGELKKEYLAGEFNKPNKIFKKTNFLSLVYNINTIVPNEFDEENLPIVQEVNKFSVEEVLVKLYALKKKLSNKYVPTQVKIVDILAEGDYFTKMNTISYNLSIKIDEINVATNPTIKYNYINNDRIEDLRETLFNVASTYTLIKQYTTIHDIASSTFISFELDNSFDIINVIKKIKTGEINNDLNKLTFEKFKETFISYFVKDGIVNIFDNNEYTPCGCMVDIWVDDYKNLTVDDYQYTTISDFDIHYNINNLRFGINYDIEWNIIKQITIDSPQPYTYKLYGNLIDFEKIKLILPYTGNYDISVKINDLYNNKSFNYINGLIEVNSLIPDFIGIYKEPYRNMTVLSESKKTINDINSEIRRPYGGNVMLKDINICIDSFNQNKYANSNEFDKLDNFFIDNLKNAKIQDLSHITFDNTEFSKITNWVTILDLNYPIDSLTTLIINDFTLRKIYSDLPASFMIFDLNNINDTGTVSGTVFTEIGNNIRIKNSFEDKIFNYGLMDTNDITQVNVFLAEIRGFFTHYEFNPLYIYDISGNEIGLDRITVTGKYIADSLDCIIEYWTSNIDGNKYNNNNLIGFTKGRSYMVNNDIVETNILYQNKILPNYFQITWCSDNSKVPGMNNYNWVLYNNNTGNTWTNDDIFFNHFFNETGEYNLKLQLKDTNGNIATTIKQGLIKII